MKERSRCEFQEKWNRLYSVLTPAKAPQERSSVEALVFHLLEIQECAAAVRSQVEALLELPCGDPQAVGDILTDLEVEVYTHWRYHVRGLRRPLRRYLDRTVK